MENAKLTKKALNDFIGWTTTKYNDYMGYCTKKEAFLTAYNSLLKGHLVQVYVYERDSRFYKKGDLDIRENPEIKIVERFNAPVQLERMPTVKQEVEEHLTSIGKQANAVNNM